MPGISEAFQKFDRFSQRARKVFALAQEEAQGFNHNYIGTEHLLLGLIREGDGVAAKVLQGLGVELSDVRTAVGIVIGRGHVPVTGALGYTPRAIKVVELAVDEARQQSHTYVGTEHILLGLIREGEGIAAGVLTRLGVELEKAREQTLAVLGGKGPEPRDAVLTCRVGASDLRAIDILVEAGIRTTRSDAASWLIRAGIDSHQELFQRVSATVSEIRRLRQEAQTIAKNVVTDELPPDTRKEPEGSGAT